MLSQLTVKITSCIATIITIASASALLPPPLDAAQRAEDAAINYQIIERTDELRSKMNMQQRVQLLAIEEQIDAAESTITSGNFLINAKPSALNPERDVRAQIARGKKMLATGNASLVEARNKLVSLLEACDAARQRQVALATEKFNSSLTTQTYSEALQNCRTILQACWEQGYETIFFDKVFITSETSTRPLNSELSELAYNAFVKADGTRFSISMPSELALAQRQGPEPSAKFVYNDAASYSQGNIALITMEIITSQYRQVLLSMRAIDLNTYEILSHALCLISDYPPTEAKETAPAETAAGTIEQAASFPCAITIRDENMWIDRFAQLQNPYKFEVIDAQLKESIQANLAKSVLEDSILRNSTLTLIDTGFINRSYGKALKTPIKLASASLNLIPAADGSIKITAQAAGSENIIEIGSMSLQ